MSSAAAVAAAAATAHDEALVLESIQESMKAATSNCMPFGCVIAETSSGSVVVRAQNRCLRASQRGGNTSVDVTRHAEMEAVRELARFPEVSRDALTIYSSTMPCVMCAGAIYWSGISRVVYGCSAQQLEQVSGPGGLDVDPEKLYGMASKGARQMTVVGPLCHEQALQVHRASGVWGSGGTAKPPATTPPSSQADQDIQVEQSLKASGFMSDEVVTTGQVPIIDLSKGTDDDVRAKLWDAATNIGFFTVVGHGIDHKLIGAAFAESKAFFEQPTSVKAEQSPLDMSINCGFEHFAQIRPSTGVADQKESLQVTARDGCMEGRWPSDSFRHTSMEFLEAAHGLAGRILSLLEPLAVPHVPPGTLAQSHNLWSHDGQCTLRYLHYPAMDTESTAKLLEDGYWRAGPHTDWTNVTLLFQQPDGKGLECCANPRKAPSSSTSTPMAWTAVDPLEGGIAINIGDMLARWSDGRLYSNLHRVRLPADATKPRYSIAFFAQSDKSVVLDAQSGKSEPITAGEYILSRIRSNFAEAAGGSSSSGTGK
jgi:isopenicillin N synthase-like dioxygenase/tRNA(Arg) A34 adenosine deaminase TadA